jgi:GDPmannose 4,6-dehydratase
VIGTGESHSVAEFVAEALAKLTGFPQRQGGTGLLEEYVEVDHSLLRAGEIYDLRADASLARQELGWEPKVDFRGLVKMMVEADMARGEAALPTIPQRRQTLA